MGKLKLMLMLQTPSWSGAIAKDNHGKILFVVAQSLPRCSSVVIMKTQVVIQGLYLTQQFNYFSMIIKTNSQQVWKKIQIT